MLKNQPFPNLSFFVQFVVRQRTLTVFLAHQGHGFQVAKSRPDLHLFNAIVVCSGDGLVSEVQII